MSWQVSRVGFTPIKGTRHQSLDEARLDLSGPVGDRLFCLVDPAAARALRTVDNPGLVAMVADLHDGRLRVRFPDGSEVEAVVLLGDQVVRFDYWGRQVTGRVVDGPWADAFSDHLGRRVVLVACAPGDVVFGDSVTMITTSALANLGRALAALGHTSATAVDAARLRATLVVDDHRDPSDGAGPREVGRPGHRLAVGDAVVEITGVVARCAVIDIHPVTGVRDGRLMKTLGRIAERDTRFGDPVFGMQARVLRPGVVRPGDAVRLL